MGVKLMAGLVLALVLLAGCSGGGGRGSSTEEGYWMLGGEMRATSAGVPSSELLAELASLRIETGLYYRVSYKKDHTRLLSGPATFREFVESGPAGSEQPAAYFAGLRSTAEGLLWIDGDEAELTATLYTSAGQEPVRLHGRFNRSEAQTAIDKLRKGQRLFNGVETGAESFEINWTIEGTLDGEEFSFSATQEMQVQRLTFSTPI